MRRILSAVGDYVADLCNRTSNGWSDFWFTPADPTVLGLIRVMTGSMLVYTHAVWGLRLHDFFGPDGWMGEAATQSLQEGQFIFSYLWYVPPQWLQIVHTAAMVVLILFTFGVLTRVTSVLSFLILINYAHRAPAALFGLDQINALLTMYLAIGASGGAFSIDRLFARYWRARRSLTTDPVTKLRLGPVPSVSANISLRLIQVHMCVIYLFAGLSKLLGESWWDGTAIWRVAASYEYQSLDVTWLANAPLLVNVLTHFAAFWELSYCVLVWPKLTRPLVLTGAVIVHLAIGCCMGMMTFGLIMLVANISFVSPSFARDVVSSLARRRRSLTVVFDGACNLCVRSMSFIKALDTGDRINPVDFNRTDPQAVHPLLTRDACTAAMQVIVHDRGELRLFSGYWGFKVIASKLRLFWPIVPLFYLPGAGLVGPLIYRLIARNRSRRLGCNTDACASHSAGVDGIDKRARAPVELTIRLPEDANLFVQDQLYPGKGRRRRFTSTPARLGKDYVFNLRVEVVREGVVLSMSQEVRLRAGQHSEVRFWLGEPGQPNESEGGNGDKRWDRIVAPVDDEPCSLEPVEKCEVQS